MERSEILRPGDAAQDTPDQPQSEGRKNSRACPIEALVMTVREMGMIATFSDVYFPQIKNTFDEKGQLLDESVIKRIETAYQELIWMAKSLKWGRENLKSIYHS